MISSAGELLRLRYEYDGLGRVTEVIEDGAVNKTINYTYDVVGQLTEVADSAAPSAQYRYDDNGNRTQVNAPGVAIGAGQIQHDADDRLLSYGATQFAYNANGQRVSSTTGGTTTTYTCGLLGELRAVSRPGLNITYQHDALRRRVGRTKNGVVTHRDRINPVAEVDAAGATTTAYIYGTGLNVPDYMVRSGQVYYIARDHLGSVRMVVNTADGGVAQALSYDAFGRVTADTNPGFQPFGFAGGLYDPDTGLTRFGVRDYDADVGRWTAPDPIGFGGGQTNLYVYVGNSPVSFVDPSGRLGFLAVVAIAAIAGGVAGGLGYLFSTPKECRTGKGMAAWIGGGVVGGLVLGAGGWVVGAGLVGAGTAGLAELAYASLFFGIPIGVASSSSNYVVSVGADPGRDISTDGMARAVASGVVLGPFALGTGLFFGPLVNSSYTSRAIFTGTNRLQREGISRGLAGNGRITECGCK